MTGPSKFPIRRCSGCDLEYTRAKEFELCPACGRPTWETSGQPMTIAAAAQIRVSCKAAVDRQMAFEAFYLKRELRKLSAEIDEWGVLDKEPQRKVLKPHPSTAFQGFGGIFFTPDDS